MPAQPLEIWNEGCARDPLDHGICIRKNMRVHLFKNLDFYCTQPIKQVCIAFHIQHWGNPFESLQDRPESVHTGSLEDQLMGYVVVV